MFTIEYPENDKLLPLLKQHQENSIDFILLITGALKQRAREGLRECLTEYIRVLRKNGLLFVQGTPDQLPEIGVFLDRALNFKYWIAVESNFRRQGNGLPSVHAAILLFTKGNDKFNLHKVRFPHEYCKFCGKSLRDWGEVSLDAPGWVSDLRCVEKLTQGG